MALTGEEQRIWDNLEQVINVENALIRRGDQTNPETGEIMKVTRLSLIDTDGVIHSTQSTAALADFIVICKTLGEPPWSPPAVIYPSKGTSRRGFSFLKLQYKGRLVGKKGGKRD